MPKITLTEAWMFAGTTYLPGEHDVSDELVAVFQSRKAIAPAAQPAATVPVPATPPNAPSEPAADPLVELVGAEAAASLKNAGYGTAEAWRTVDDATLLALEHVGKATVKKLRENQE
jgi:nitroreductase